MLRILFSKKSLLSLLFFKLGCFFTIITYKNVVTCSNLGSVNGLTEFSSRFHRLDFLNIFISNIIVLTIILFLGFFSAGIISFCVLFWNGLTTSLVFIEYVQYYSNYETAYAFSHGIIELPVFIIASNISLRGISFYKEIYNNNFLSSLIPSKGEYTTLIAILLVAASIEVSL